MNYDVAVIGCGFVGLCLAAALNQAGVTVLGVEPRDWIREKVRSGVAPFREPGLAEAMAGLTMANRLQPEDEADAYIIAVGTPVIDDGALERATREVSGHMRDGALVIVRSTVRVGTTRKVVKPILEASGKSFHLAYCPERTVEGNALAELHSLPQILSADTLGAWDRAYHLFGRISPIYMTGLDWEEAETAKLLANAWRSAAFAFANEVALLCEANGVSAKEAIDAANWNYPRSAIPRPGPVGGPCLPKDVELLSDRSKTGFSVIRSSAHLNSPAVIASSITKAITARGFGDQCSIAVLGTAFKGRPETDDTRDSPGLSIARLLARGYSKVVTVDPVAEADLFVDEFEQQTFDVIVVVTDHPAWGAVGDFCGINTCLNPGGFVYDACGYFRDASDDDSYVRWGG